MPEISRFFGIIIRMFMEAGAAHHTPHFHAYYQEHAGVFSIDPVELIAGEPAARAAAARRGVGGTAPRRTGNRPGTPLFYIDLNGTLTAVGMDLDAAEFGTPHGPFATGLRLTPYSMWMNQYAVANDGQSLLFNRPVEQPDATITALLPR